MQADWSQATNTADDYIKNKPTLGTAAAKNIPAAGNASATEVVYGTDTRLTDARTPTSHTHAQSDITNLTTDLSGKEPTITAGTTAQYYRGDKSWQTLDKTAVGLGNVDNTSDATKNSATVTLTNKTLTAPVLSGTVTGTYTIGGTPTFPSTVVSTTGTQTLTNKTLTTPLIDTISEKTAANGVTIDSLNIKDGKLNTNNSVVTANITDAAVTAAKIEAQQAWQAPTLTNSWVNYGDGLTNAGYMKDSLGFVHFRGLVKNGTVGSAIYTLPTGYRPGNVAAFAVVSNSAFGFLQVTAAGAVVLIAGSNAFVYLDGVTFRAEG